MHAYRPRRQPFNAIATAAVLCRRHSAFCILNSAFLLAQVFVSLSPAQDNPFAAGVRTTPWLSPAEEQKLFKLPPGFEIQLVAAEPDIQKPLNMAFDERGRIWLTCTVEYPYAAPPDRPGRDSIRVLEDTDGDGRFEKVQVFADGLNIPMGIYPWKGGCVAFSIPNIWHFEDTDGDGVCDKRTVLYGPFDTSRDTHGMVNSFRRGWDGWVYACHGFNNDSRVKGKDGHEIHMQSGNTFRFQLDGSRIEHFTHGQVNPFGVCFDELFNIFTADCHSKPIYQLLRGGYYPSFGKPHDGLGFVPPMMDHLHGSTAICGLVKYSGENFPEEYRGDFYSGNVMTSRINRNKPEYHGSTIKAIEQPDFLTTDDPWFRPVDIHVGPDGAMYVLDFYNRIIGHYEVPLTHPGRDRTSGRIWRVVYKKPPLPLGEGGERSSPGEGPKEPSAVKTRNDLKTLTPALSQRERGQARPLTLPPDLTKLSLSDLIAQLDSPQLEHRLRVLNYLTDIVGQAAIAELKAARRGSLSGGQQIAINWALERLDRPGFVEGLESESRDVQTHALKAYANRNAGDPYSLTLLLRLAADKDSFVARAAADAIGRHPLGAVGVALLPTYAAAPQDDLLLRHTQRMAIRDNLAMIDKDDDRQHLKLNDEGMRLLLPIAAATPTPFAASLLIRDMEQSSEPRERLIPYLQHAARYAAGEDSDRLIRACQQKFADDLDLQAQVIQSLAAGLQQRGDTKSAALTTWGEHIAAKLLTAQIADAIPWTAVPIDGLPPSENPWVIAARPSRDGDKDSLFFSSLPKGEQRTGIYRSGEFAIPEKLSFWCAGHSGRPPQPMNDGNYVRLRDAVTHQILAESRPPRNDTAQRFEWDLKAATSGRGLPPTRPAPGSSPPTADHPHLPQTATTGRGYVELVDGDAGDAYAWLAVGRFSLLALNPSDTPRKQALAAEIIGKLKLTSLRPHIASLAASPQTDGIARTAAAQALVALDPDSRAAALVVALSDPSIPAELRPRLGYAITVKSDAEYLENLREVMKRVPSRLQATIAETLVGDIAGAELLLTLIESGHAAPRLLQAPSISSKLAALKNAELDKRAAAVIAKLPPANAVLDALIVDRRRGFARAATNAERGQAVFTKHCAACHQLEGQGAVIGPQLDGIGNRGLDRLLEDLLDPSRNVDVAFRTTTLRLADGRVLSGLVRREEGTQLVLADTQGKEFTVAQADIEEQQPTPLSLMPANVGEIATAEEFYDLLAFLLSRRPTAAP